MPDLIGHLFWIPYGDYPREPLIAHVATPLRGGIIDHIIESNVMTIIAEAKSLYYALMRITRLGVPTRKIGVYFLHDK